MPVFCPQVLLQGRCRVLQSDRGDWSTAYPGIAGKEYLCLMDRIRKLFLRIHILVWVLFSALVAFQLKEDESTRWLGTTFIFLLTDLYIFYSHFFILTRYTGQRKRKGYLLRLAGIVLTGPLIFAILHSLDRNAENLFQEYYGMALVTLVPIFIFLSWLARVTENLVLNTIRKEQLEKEAIQAELHNLRSQINPHFLFNTLNNIHTLVYKQAPAAPEAVMRLASLMRYMIYESNAPVVPLSREMDYLKDYVTLQQLRYKQAPVEDFHIEGDIRSYEIAPLLFIHLLENAYKHSPARLEAGDIKIHLVVHEKSLTFTVQNPVNRKPVNSLEGPGGIGLENVRKRLTLLYAGQHQLEISSTEDTYNINLNITRN